MYGVHFVSDPLNASLAKEYRPPYTLRPMFSRFHFVAKCQQPGPQLCQNLIAGQRSDGSRFDLIFGRLHYVNE